MLTRASIIIVESRKSAVGSRQSVSLSRQSAVSVDSQRAQRMGITRRVLLQALVAQVIRGDAFAQARVHAKPKPLAKDAVTHDWTAFLGPAHNAVSTETGSAGRCRLRWSGSSQGHRLRLAGHHRRPAGVHPSRGRRRDRRVPARRDGASTGDSAIPPTSKIGTDTTTVRERAR